MNKRILPIAAAAALTLLFSSSTLARERAVRAPGSPGAAYSEGGYADATSVAQGGMLGLHVATSVSPFDLSIVSLADPSVTLTTIHGLQSIARDCSRHFADGCAWPVATTIAIPASWPSGYYAAVFPTSAGDRYAPFVVRAAQPGSAATTLVVSSTNTFQAYNDFGGESAQPSDSAVSATAVSFQRPYGDADGLGGFVDWERDFATWLRQQQIPFEVATDADLEDPTLLGHYDDVVFVGHSEYWTANARKNLETYLAHGGNATFLGGNTMWWQARRSADGQQLITFKNASADPNLGVDDSTVTVNWFDYPLFDPENLVTGASFRSGGYVNRAGDPSTWSPDPKTFVFRPMSERVGFNVLDGSSWVYDGTGLQAGQQFGRAAAGLEVDGAVFNCDSQQLPSAPDGSDGTPLNYHVLAYVPASSGYGTVGWYVTPSGGAVFNAGSEEWPSALLTDSDVSRVTWNVLQRFATGTHFPYDPVTATAKTLDLFNCPQPMAGVIPWWSGETGDARIDATCAHEGPGGLELTGPGEISLVRGFDPHGGGLQQANVRFFVNADGYHAETPWPVPVVTLRGRRGTTLDRYAQVELYVAAGKTGIRLTTLTPEGDIATATRWFEMPPGWNQVDIAWSSPGNVTFTIGSSSDTIANTRGGEAANELELYYPQLDGDSIDRICLDAMGVSATAF